MIAIQNYKDLSGWGDAKGYTGVKIKTLREVPDSKIAIMKFPPGQHSKPHHHDCNEHQLILEGEWEANGQIFPPGSYIRYSPKEDHGPFSAKKDTVILVIWES